MKKISNTETFGKIFGDAIVAHSLLNKKYVINSKAIYGGTMQVSEDDKIFDTFKPSDTFVVFYIEHAESGDTITEDSKSLTVYDSFKVTLSCYGKENDMIAARLYSRFQTQEALLYFEEEGVHIQSIDNEGDLTDFLNGHLVRRRDLIIHFSCEIDATKIINETEFEEMNSEFEVYMTR